MSRRADYLARIRRHEHLVAALGAACGMLATSLAFTAILVTR